MRKKLEVEIREKVFDLQTVSIFVALGLLTGILVVSFSWALGGA